MPNVRHSTSKSNFKKSKICFKYTIFFSVCISLITLILCILNNNVLKYQLKHQNSNGVVHHLLVQNSNNTKFPNNSTINTQSPSTQNSTINTQLPKGQSTTFDRMSNDIPDKNELPEDFEDVLISNKTVFIEGDIITVYNKQ